MHYRLLAIGLLSLLAMFGLTPTASATGATVAAGTYTVSCSNPAYNGGTVVSDGHGTISWTSTGGTGAVWVQNASGVYKKQNPKPNEVNLELTFTATPTGYSWVLVDAGQYPNLVASGTMQVD